MTAPERVGRPDDAATAELEPVLEAFHRHHPKASDEMLRRSYQLAAEITSTKNQIQECTRFGMIPVRKDILSDMSMMFGGGWITQIYSVSFQQLMHNKSTVVPVNPNFDKIGALYLDAWFDIVVGKNWSGSQGQPDRAHIAKVIETAYATKAESILGRR